jgi:hypothetical protein
LSFSLVRRRLLTSLSAVLDTSIALAFLVAVAPVCRAQASQVPTNQVQVAQANELDDVLGGLSAEAMSNDSGPAGIIPVQKGFNVSLGTSSQHDSSNGWSSILTPNVAYRLNRYISVDAGVPMYMYINIDANVGTKTKPVYKYITKKDAFGDTSDDRLQRNGLAGSAIRQHGLWPGRRAGDLQHQ